MDLFLGACGDGLVVYVICSSWNWRRDVTYFLCSAVIIGFGASVIFVGQSIFHLLDNKDIAVINLEVVQTCNISNVPSSFIKLFIVYALMDLLSLVFFVLNALSRPRNASQRLTDILVKDGITFLVVSLILKLSTVLVIAKAPAPIALTFPVFSITLISTATARFYLRFCSARIELQRREDELCSLSVLREYD